MPECGTVLRANAADAVCGWPGYLGVTSLGPGITRGQVSSNDQKQSRNS